MKVLFEVGINICRSRGVNILCWLVQTILSASVWMIFQGSANNCVFLERIIFYRRCERLWRTWYEVFLSSGANNFVAHVRKFLPLVLRKMRNTVIEVTTIRERDRERQRDKKNKNKELLEKTLLNHWYKINQPTYQLIDLFCLWYIIDTH